MKVTVTGAVVSGNGIMLFFADGQSRVLPQDSWRTQEIMAAVTPGLAASQPTEIDLDAYTLAGTVSKIIGADVKVKETSADGYSLEANGVKITNGEALQQHVERAATDGAKGFRNFLRKFAEIKRQHSSDELLKFIEGADLPIADNGDLIGFKVLLNKAGGYMTDPHTDSVQQHLGSVVFMPASKVDDNRRVACSTGLHIASRRYLSSFWGGGRKLCLVKIQPKDVIAVPLYESSKMRVSAYHIVGVFSDEDAQQIINYNKPIHELPKAHELLSDIVAGSHTPIVERVEVGEHGAFKAEIVKVKANTQKPKKRKRAKVSPTAAKTQKPVVKIDPRNLNIYKRLLRAHPELKTRDSAYMNKLIKAQRMLDDGKSIRTIAPKLGMDRESLGKNLIRKAA